MVIPIILDGGTGQLLVDYGHEKITKDHPMWATGALELAPKLVHRVHKEFAEAGAQILFSNTYSLFSISEDEAVSKAVIRNVLKISRDILTDICTKYDIRYAVSIGPLAVKYHDCSEYNGSYLIDGRATLCDVKSHYRWILDEAELLGETLIACETIPSLAEVQVISNLTKYYPSLKFFVTLRANSATKSAHGDSIQEAAKLISKNDQIIGFGINCFDPRFAVEFAKQTRGLIGEHQRLIVKPNDGKIFNLEKNKFDGAAYDFLADLNTLASLGVGYIGGCCTVLPDTIKTYTQHFEKYVV